MVISVNHLVAGHGLQLINGAKAAVKGRACEDDACARRLALLDLDGRRVGRQDQRGSDAMVASRKADRDRVVASTLGDHPAGASLLRHPPDGPHSAAHLIGATTLQVLRLQPQAGPGNAVERRGAQRRCPDNATVQPVSRRGDVAAPEPPCLLICGHA